MSRLDVFLSVSLGYLCVCVCVCCVARVIVKSMYVDAVLVRVCVFSL